MLLVVAVAAALVAAFAVPAARRGTLVPPAGAPAPGTAAPTSTNAQTLERLPGPGAAAAASSPAPLYRPGAVLVGFRSGVSDARERAIEQAAGAWAARRLGPAIRPVGHGRATGQEYLAPLELRVPNAQVIAVVNRLQRDSAVAYAEPNYLQTGSATPNDPEFVKQWGDENTGQPIPFQNQEEKLGAEEKGTPGADDKAYLAWGVSIGSRSIVIGVTDTGVAYEHPDLAANIWSNPGGVGGCAAGTHGYNVLAKTCNPVDEDASYNGHGTHVAGIVGAVANNGVGVAGMNWQTSILPMRWMNNASSGETSALIEALQWLVAAKQAGVNVRVVNDSDTFFGTAKSEALSNEIETLGANNILFVTAAGNTGNNNDEVSVQRYPCSYDRANEICVTATNNKDELPSWANYGPHTVQLAAPGVSIYSTLRGNSYGYLSGGSMASPQVAGAAALILSVSPSLSATEVRARILENVDKLPSLEGKVITGGRLDVCKALPGCTLPAIPQTFGKSAVGASPDTFVAERKRANRYTLATSGSVTKLSIYLAPTSTSGQQVMRGVIYSDVSGKPETLLGVSEQLTFKSTNTAGWYDLPFASPVNLSAGNYWIGVMTGASASVAGFRYDSVSSSRDYNTNTYSSGPTNPFGAVTVDSEQMSLYATYIVAPVNTAPPTISGTAQQGQTLTESHGSWTNSPTSFSYQWQQCNSEGNACTAISGATAQTYVPVAGDVGHTIRVQETASNSSGAGSPATSTATAVVVPPAPTNSAPPTISGTAQQGQTLTEGHGSWTNSPTSFSYQWQQCDGAGNVCTAISGATAQTYVPVAGDVGHTIRVQETASNAAGASAPATSAATAVVLPAVPVNSAPPTISGTAQQGQTLTEAHGSWTNSPTSFSYQWQQCNSEGISCASISGATKQTYELATGDVGHTIRVQETATNAGGPSAPASSAATAVVTQPAPTNTSPPTISGTAQQGQTLTEAHGSWTNNPTSFTYQWEQCQALGNECLPISGATKQTYEVTAGDVGHTIKVQETATNAGGSSTPAISAATATVVPLPPSNTSSPTITGTAQQGQILTEAHGTWTNNPTGFTYQWQQCDGAGNVCTAISGATSQIYELTAGDVGHTIKVQETATNAGGSSAPASSAATATVVPLPPSDETPPTITGTAQQAQTLTEHNGKWTNNPTGYSYQWLQCDALGASCLPISGATKQTYVPVSGDVGHTLRVQETASNAGGSGTPATSEPTSVVAPPGPAPSNETPPTITGTAQQGQTLTEHHGSWKNEPTSYSYQWLQCNGEGSGCTNISGATKQTYEVAAADVGHTLRVQEEAGNVFGTSNPVTSAATAVVTPPAPTNVSVPTITGTAQQGQTLTEHNGTWTNEPTSYAYQWLQCNGEGSGCTNVSGATKQTYELAAADVGHTIKVQETATNAGGSSAPGSSAATATVVPPPPSNETPPTITGTAQQGRSLTEVHGTWSNTPTSYAYQWLQCNSEGGGCTNISGATKQSYEEAAADVGHTIKVQETAINAGGSSAPASSSATATVIRQAPVNTTPPTITGTAQQGQTLTEHSGTWTNEPTSYAYQWLQCDSLGNSCLPISGATTQTYVPGAGDVGHALKVQEEARNEGGSSGPAISSATAAVQKPSEAFGKTNVGGSSDQFAASRKRANRYALPTAGALTNLTVYLAPTGKTGQQVMKGVVYSDQAGAPSVLLGVTEQLTFHSTNVAGWYEMTFASPVKLAAGSYWIGVITGSTAYIAGFRYDPVAGSRDYNNNSYSAGPSNPFGSVTVDSEQMSLYATYTPGA